MTLHFGNVEPLGITVLKIRQRGYAVWTRPDVSFEAFDRAVAAAQVEAHFKEHGKQRVVADFDRDTFDGYEA